MTQADGDMEGDPTGLWVFGYGSLIWNPDFTYRERVLATLEGYDRSFCMLSVHHRGTAEVPGLVLALDPKDGSACQGLAFAVAESRKEATLQALRDRELISSAYHEAWVPLTLSDGRQVTAVTYVVDPDHEQYCGGMALEDQARIIARAHGGRGPNRDYLENTAAHLRQIGLDDTDLDWLVARVEAIDIA